MSAPESSTHTAVEMTPGEWNSYKRKHPGASSEHHKLRPKKKRGPKNRWHPPPGSRRGPTVKAPAGKGTEESDAPESTGGDASERFFRDESFRSDCLGDIADLMRDPPAELLQRLVERSEWLFGPTSEEAQQSTAGQQQAAYEVVKSALTGAFEQYDQLTPDFEVALSEYVADEVSKRVEEEPLTQETPTEQIDAALQVASDTLGELVDGDLLEQLQGRVDPPKKKEGALALRVARTFLAGLHERHQQVLDGVVEAVYQEHHERPLRALISKVHAGWSPPGFKVEGKSRRNPSDQAVIYLVHKALSRISEAEVREACRALDFDPYRYDPRAVQMALNGLRDRLWTSLL